MTKPLLIGVTGGIGSGKSTVCRIFQAMGVPVYYADDRGKFLMSNDEGLIQEIKKEFGEESYDENGALNREYLAKTVFADTDRLKVLNSFVHPAVARDFETWVNINSDHPYLLKEAALLYEIGSYKELDKTICVMAPKKVRIERVLLRDIQRKKEQVEQIMSKQTDDATRRNLADYQVSNKGDLLLIPQVLNIHEELLNSVS
ncbi:dephospho-CoA kinase [Roseivirga misakiensis]|uniref:Dephospho-CoA kinase n=1 Tax=Roseivirga misakiensis TaxID=1563681 RepID=A0A1E5T4Q3_9BACT|nr:dephospho-CoA kinase [Roseivirga misakiensis]OEK06321.1 dephospho-CoA kinase [Roseivirga misakiensis]